MTSLRYFWCLTTLCAASIFTATAFAAEPLSLDAFAAHEQMKNPTLSPDGRYLAVLSSKEGRRIALVRDLKGDDKWVSVISTDAAGTADLEWCEWVTEKRLLCGFTGVALVNRFNTPNVKLALVDADGKNLKESLSLAWILPARFNAGIIEPTRESSNQVAVQMVTLPPDIPGFAPSGGSMGYRYVIDIDSGKSSPSKTAGPQRAVRAVADGDVSSVKVSEDGKGWRRLDKASEFAKTNPLTDMHVNSATGRAFGYALQNGRKALWEFALDDKSAPVVGFAHPKVDVGDVLFDRKGAVIGVSYETDRPRVQYVEEKLAATMRGLDKALPDTFNRIESMSDDRTVLVISARSDIEAGRYYLYDSASKKMSDVGSQYPDLDKTRLARMVGVEIAAQDGAKIPGYLTVPPDKTGQKLPLIVVPQSGYDGRARWGFSSMTQFLASRGYAVLTVNYRGSLGYGAEWLKAGRSSWDTVVESDVSDSARWAVAQGIADPERICTMGQGFGGYPAQLAAVRHPELFKCAIGVGARTDVQIYSTLANNIDNRRYYVESEDSTRPTRRRSELLQSADQMKGRVLLIHGTQDTRASFSQAEDYDQALESAGKQHKLVKIEKGDWSFWRVSERTLVLKELEAFLAGSLQ